MRIRQRFDPEKALEVLLYVAERCSDMYTALKILYFADKQHLAEFGRQIYGDSYVAMKEGPVPSGAYDLVKFARGDGWYTFSRDVQEALDVRDRITLVPRRKANIDLLSESDIQCLDNAIRKYGHMSFGRLKKLSHRDGAYRRADRNDFISLEEIIKTLPDGELLREHLLER